MIREARPADASEIAAIHYASRRYAYKTILSEELLNDRTKDDLTVYWTKQFELPVLKRGQIFVVEHQQQLIGFVVLVADSYPAEIDRIYVRPTHLGKGAGTAMIAHCLDLLRTSYCRDICVWVFEGNSAARRFYESQGFLLDGNFRQSVPYPREIRYSRLYTGA